MSDSSYVKDVEAERLALTQKLRDKGVDEVVEEISARLAMEAKQRRDLIESVRRLTDENGELRARLALARGQHGGTETHPKLAGQLELARPQTIGEEVEAALPETAAETATKKRADPPAEVVERPAKISKGAVTTDVAMAAPAAAAQDSVFDQLRGKDVPHIIEKIFLYLDYESYKNCFEVSTTWRSLLTSEPFMKKARLEFRLDIEVDQEKLIDASTSGDAQTVQKLLSLGFLDIGPGSAWPNFTPLGRAAFKGHDEVIRILLDMGADPNFGEKRDGGTTPLHWAARGGHEATAKLLLDAGANPNKADGYGPKRIVYLCYGHTPLHDAAFNGHGRVVKVLLERGAEPDKTNGVGSTPLHLAAETGRKSVAKMLLERGADPRKANEYGQTPLSLAMSPSLVPLLRRRHAFP